MASTRVGFTAQHCINVFTLFAVAKWADDANDAITVHDNNTTYVNEYNITANQQLWGPSAQSHIQLSGARIL